MNATESAKTLFKTHSTTILKFTSASSELVAYLEVIDRCIC